MTARDCEMYAAASIESLARQTYGSIHVLYVDDCSSDATGTIARNSLEALFPGRHTYIRNETRFGKARNAWEHLRPRAANFEFIAVLDGDDRLINPEIISWMSRRYGAGKDVVWTNYVTDTGGVGGNGPLDPTSHPRNQGWKTSHFFSFRASLLGNVPENYYQDSNGKWLPAACDLAIAFPILDQTRRYEFIQDNAYLYIATNPYSHHNLDPQSRGLNSRIQQSCVKEVITKPPLPLIHSLATPVAPAVPQQSLPSDDMWGRQALNLLVSAAPTLLNAHSVVSGDKLSAMQIWSLYQYASRHEGGKILHLGNPSSAIYLAALIPILKETQLICVSSSEDESDQLEAMLAASGLAQSAHCFATGLSKVNIQDKSGYFPDLQALGDDHRFSMILVDERGMEHLKLPQVAFPCSAALLSPVGFTLCLLTTDHSSDQEIARYWQERTTGVKFCLNAIGGSGIVIIGGR